MDNPALTFGHYRVLTREGSGAPHELGRGAMGIISTPAARGHPVPVIRLSCCDTMKKLVVCALALLLGCGCLPARPARARRPHRASPREVIAFMRRDLGTLPAGTRFKRVHWDSAMQEWEVTLEPPFIFGVWMVNPTATDYKHMCFFYSAIHGS